MDSILEVRSPHFSWRPFAQDFPAFDASFNPPFESFSGNARGDSSSENIARAKINASQSDVLILVRIGTPGARFCGGSLAIVSVVG
jgi:hypothetical protein